MQPLTSPQAPSHDRVLGLFAKWPTPGAVKTRLTAGGDPDLGARVAQAFLLDALHRFTAVDADRILVFTPEVRRAEFAAVAGGRFALIPQTKGDLGERMSAFVEEQTDAGARSVVLVGTDSPTLPVEYVERAFTELERADVVLGPATDGGYYLVGCGRRRPALFDGVTWGGGRVLAETVAAMADPQWRLAVLPPWYDVDTPADWTMLCGHLIAMGRAGADQDVPHTEALIREMGA